MRRPRAADLEPDGSQAEKSGNGLRIFARWLVEHRDAPSEFTVEVPAGVVRCRVDEASGLVTVEMGVATLEPETVPCSVRLRDTAVEVHGSTLRLTAVGMGNPHCVAIVDETDLDALPWRDWGRSLEVDPRFPNRTNVQVARVIDRANLEARIWERGAGETLASGSSACAVAVAARVLDHVDGDVTVHMPGGTLRVQVGVDLAVVQTGPVEEVASVLVPPVDGTEVCAGGGRRPPDRERVLVHPIGHFALTATARLSVWASRPTIHCAPMRVMLIRPPARHTVESEVPEAEAENLSHRPGAALDLQSFLGDQPRGQDLDARFDDPSTTSWRHACAIGRRMSSA